MNFQSKFLSIFLITLTNLNQCNSAISSPGSALELFANTNTFDCPDSDNIPVGCFDLCHVNSTNKHTLICPFDAHGSLNIPEYEYPGSKSALASKNAITSTSSLNYQSISQFSSEMLDLFNKFRGATASEDTRYFSNSYRKRPKSLFAEIGTYWWRSPEIANMHNVKWDQGLQAMSREWLNNECTGHKFLSETIKNFDESQPDANDFANLFEFDYLANVDDDAIFGWTMFIPSGGITQEMMPQIITNGIALYWYTRVADVFYAYNSNDNTFECSRASSSENDTDIQCIFMKRMIYADMCSIGCDYSLSCGSLETQILLTCYAYGFTSDLKPANGLIGSANDGLPLPFIMGTPCSKCSNNPLGTCFNSHFGLCQCGCQLVGESCVTSSNCCSGVCNEQDGVCVPGRNEQPTKPPVAAPTLFPSIIPLRSTVAPSLSPSVSKPKDCDCTKRNECECKGGVTSLTLIQTWNKKQQITIKNDVLKTIFDHEIVHGESFTIDKELSNAINIYCDNNFDIKNGFNLSCKKPIVIGQYLACGLVIIDGDSKDNGQLCDMDEFSFNHKRTTSGGLTNKMDRDNFSNGDKSNNKRCDCSGVWNGSKYVKPKKCGCHDGLINVALQNVDLIEKQIEVVDDHAVVLFNSSVAKHKSFWVRDLNNSRYVYIDCGNFDKKIKLDISCKESLYISQEIGCGLEVINGYSKGKNAQLCVGQIGANDNKCCNERMVSLFLEAYVSGNYYVVDNFNNVLFNSYVKNGGLITIQGESQFIIVNNNCKIDMSCNHVLRLDEDVGCNLKVSGGESRHGHKLCSKSEGKNGNEYKIVPGPAVGLAPTRQPYIKDDHCCEGKVYELVLKSGVSDTIIVTNHYGEILFHKDVLVNDIITLYLQSDVNFIVNDLCYIDTTCDKALFIGQDIGCNLVIVEGYSQSGALCNKHGFKPGRSSRKFYGKGGSQYDYYVNGGYNHNHGLYNGVNGGRSWWNVATKVENMYNDNSQQTNNAFHGYSSHEKPARRWASYY